MSKEALEAKERGNAAYKDRDFAAAHAHYDEAIRLSSQEMVFYSNKSAVFFQEGKFGDCIATCKKALNVGSENKILIVKVMARIGKAKMAQGKTSEAYAWMEKALAEHSSPETDKMIADFLHRRRLSDTYAPELISLVMEDSKDKKAGKRARALVMSSPTMTSSFVKFMARFNVTVRDPFVIDFFGADMIDDPKFDVVYVKKWSSFSWIAPFIVRLFICDTAPDAWSSSWAYAILSRTSKVLNSFTLHVPEGVTEPLHPVLLPFIRQRWRNLETLYGPIEFFLELPPNPPKPKAFKNVAFDIYKFGHFATLFKTKRFTSREVEIHFFKPAVGRFEFANRFTKLMKEMPFRMPETRRVNVLLPVPSAQFAAADLVNAVYSVFPNIQILVMFFNLPTSKIVVSLDRKRLAKDYAFLVKEVEKMPPQLRVHFHFEQYVKFSHALNALREMQTPLRGFTLLDNNNQNPWLPSSRGFVNRDENKQICHGNKCLRYEVTFH